MSGVKGLTGLYPPAVTKSTKSSKMARNNRTSSRPSSNKPAQAQRPHSTTAAAKIPQTQQAQPPAVQAQSGGMFSNILQTAAGVAIGHTVGRMISGVFDSGNPAATTDNNSNTHNAPVQCQSDTKKFLDCMQQNYDDVSPCQNYLEMLKQCQRQFAQ